MTLHTDLTVLLPAADVSGHLWEIDFLLQECVHLKFDRVLLTISDEGGAEVNHTHRVEILVRARVTAHNTELRVENILTVASVGHAVVD